MATTPSPDAWRRLGRHLRLTWQNRRPLPDPPFLVLFVNSICNMCCEHCFYWRNLNRPDDLSFDEIVALSASLGKVENLNLSGGEPFLRKELAEICLRFVSHNGTRQIYVPTNGYFRERTVGAIRRVLEDPSLDLFVAELSLDGMPAFHDRFRDARNSFARAMETYDALVELQAADERLRIHAISTATDVNVDEIRRLTTYLYDRCPRMDHHNLAIIRGDRKNAALRTPDLDEYEAPNIEQFLDEAAVAGLTTRSERRETKLADGYLTLSAGTRSVGDPSTDGDALGVDEPFGQDDAGEVFFTRTGRRVSEGIVSLALPRVAGKSSTIRSCSTG